MTLIVTKTYNSFPQSHSPSFEPDWKTLTPASHDDVLFVVQTTFTFAGKRLMVEAMDLERRAYALRNVNGEEIKWVSNQDLQDAFKEKGMPEYIKLPQWTELNQNKQQ